MDEVLLANFEQAGITLTKMSAADRKPFAATAEQVWDAFRKDTSPQGKAMLKKILANL